MYCTNGRKPHFEECRSIDEPTPGVKELVETMSPSCGTGVSENTPARPAEASIAKVSAKGLQKSLIRKFFGHAGRWGS